MLYLPNMLLVGATGRDAGKTTFVCGLLRHFHSLALAAAKVTVIRENNGECPRGGTGCGVCSSVGDGFLLTQELSNTGNKDTHRMLAAGASRVFWLRTFLKDAEEGVLALHQKIGTDTPFICESNSIRGVVVPGLFLMVAQMGRSVIKASAKSVLHHADLVITSDGTSFDFDYDQIQITSEGWRLREQPSVAVQGGEEHAGA